MPTPEAVRAKRRRAAEQRAWLPWSQRLAAAARDADDHVGRDQEADGALAEFLDDLVLDLGDVADDRRALILGALARLLDPD